MHRSLMTLPVALLAAAVIATPAWAGEDEDDPTPTPTPTEVPTVAPPAATPVPVVPAPPAPPAATPAPQVVPVVKERNSKAPKHKKRIVHHKRAVKKVHKVNKVKFTPKPAAVLAAQVAATPAGGVQAGEGGTARDGGGLPIAGLIGGGFLLLLAGGSAVRAGVRH